MQNEQGIEKVRSLLMDEVNQVEEISVRVMFMSEGITGMIRGMFAPDIQYDEEIRGIQLMLEDITRMIRETGEVMSECIREVNTCQKSG